ncbi:hypothetical protein EVAR_36196_1 [Eumeta japonica]|uniref:Secreted protein n=1 Tax=Eumeta variegata TaxID=151549 RepID=A0A4C1VSC2_EUMVA|nr:hypothetical protein EVAR_36196_1 [Eumeta japonica]
MLILRCLFTTLITGDLIARLEATKDRCRCITASPRCPLVSRPRSHGPTIPQALTDCWFSKVSETSRSLPLFENFAMLILHRRSPGHVFGVEVAENDNEARVASCNGSPPRTGPRIYLGRNTPPRSLLSAHEPARYLVSDRGPAHSSDLNSMVAHRLLYSGLKPKDIRVES